MGSSLGSATTVVSMGHKAAECWSGGKTPFQLMHALPIDNTEAKQVANTEAKGPFFIYIKCH